MSPRLDPHAVERLRHALAGAGRVLLTGPVEVDGDSVGSSLALARIAGHLGAARVDVAGEPGWRYAELPGALEMLPYERVEGPYDVVVVLDGDRRRLAAPLVPAFEGAAVKAVVDHHESTTAEGYDIAIIDAAAASTCEMVQGLADAWGVPLDAEVARLLYTGIVYDTGGFWHSNTREETLALATRLLRQGIDHSGIVIRTVWERRRPGLEVLARVLARVGWYADGAVVLGAVSCEDLTETGAHPMDLDRIVDILLYVVGVEVAVLAVERCRGDHREVKLSLRSRGAVDVCALAHRLHPMGGGHRRAAGVLLEGTLAEVQARILPHLVAEARARGSARQEGSCG